MPPHARAVTFGRGHRFAAYPRCSTDKRTLWPARLKPPRRGQLCHLAGAMHCRWFVVRAKSWGMRVGNAPSTHRMRSRHRRQTSG